MARDNFAELVKRRLKDRVASRCSNPACRVPTTAASSDNKNKVNSIGIASHISAASPGGPRYDPSMTAIERKSISNGIWLCSNCSIDIDKDETKHTVSALKEWRKEAESLGKTELGKSLPSATETVDTLTSALTGHSKDFLAQSISNTHLANEKVLGALDPRFQVKTSYNFGLTSFNIYAKQKGVSLPLKIDSKRYEEFKRGITNHHEHGKGFEISSDAITIEGSKLFEKILSNTDGVFSFETRKIAATQKLWLVNKDTKQVEYFDDIQGYISGGSKSFSFKGTACNGLFKVGYRHQLKSARNQFTLSLNLNIWEGVNINSMPYFEKLFSLFLKMSQGWETYISLEVNGDSLLTGSCMTFSEQKYITGRACLFSYLSRCRVIAKKFKFQFLFNSNIGFTAEEHSYISDVVDVIEGNRTYDSYDLEENITSTFTVDGSGQFREIFLNYTEPNSIKMIQAEETELELFGQKINIPPLIARLESVSPKINENIEALNTGDSVQVEWLPQEGFRYFETYDIEDINTTHGVIT